MKDRYGKFTRRDWRDVKRIRNKARGIIGNGNDPDEGRKNAILQRCSKILERHAPPDPGEGIDASFAERVAAETDFLRTGRKPIDVQRNVYSMAMAYPVLNRAQRKRLRDAFVEAELTHFPISVGDEKNPQWWRLEEDFDLLDEPHRVLEACQELYEEADLLPAVLLFHQPYMRRAEPGLNELEERAQQHAEVWGPWCGLLWSFFEVDEDVPLGELDFRDSGMRGDDWLTAALGRIERAFRPHGAPVGIHFTQEEFHYFTRFERADVPSVEEPPAAPVMLFQFTSWPPDLDAIVQYDNGDGTTTPMTSREAHTKDWLYVLRRTFEETRGRQTVLPWEYCQMDPSWPDREVHRVGRMLSDLSVNSDYDGVVGYGNGATP